MKTFVFNLFTRSYSSLSEIKSNLALGPKLYASMQYIHKIYIMLSYVNVR